MQEHLQFFPTSEGYAKDTFFDDEHHFNYVYQYKDHLGNVRVSYGWDPYEEEVKIMEENNYYPYGLKHRNYNLIESEYVKIFPSGIGIEEVDNRPYNYKYNGKEWQEDLGLNMYDMDLRDYDPAIGRWVNIDPIVHFGQSTYNAFDGNPVVFADPSGGSTSFISPEFMFDSEGRRRYDGRNMFIPIGDRPPATAADLEEQEYWNLVFSQDGGGGGRGEWEGDISFYVPSFGENVDADVTDCADEESMEDTIEDITCTHTVIDSTSEAWDHYNDGKGKPVALGQNSQWLALNSPEFQYVIDRLQKGTAKNLTGTFDIDMTWLNSRVFHIGDTNVDYSTTCDSKQCKTVFKVFVDDGFWDPIFIFPSSSDRKGPHQEQYPGVPYDYIPSILVLVFNNPGYAPRK